MPRRRRFFAPEYKAEVVELIRSTGKTAGQVAKELDLTETAVREWLKRADLDAGRRADGLTTAERDELRRLRRQVRDLQEERGRTRDPAQGRELLRVNAKLKGSGGVRSFLRCPGCAGGLSLMCGPAGRSAR